MNALYLLPRFREAHRAMRVLEEREGWSRSEIQQFQLERLNTLWKTASTRVPYYASLAARHKLPPTFGSIPEFTALMPVLTKRAVAQDPTALLSSHAAPGHWLRTGGSTGAPLSVYWSHRAHREMLWARYRSQLQWGVDIIHRSAHVWGEAYQTLLDRFVDPIILRLRRRLLLSAYRLGENDLRRYLHRIARWRPATIYGYSTAVALLADHAAMRGFACESLKLVTLTGEPADRGLVRAVERGFHAPAVVEYGATECPVIATEGPDRVLRVREDMVLLETLPRADGHFELVITTLTDPSFPLIRYAMEDVTDEPLDRGERGFARLHTIGGRANDMLMTRSGRRVHSMGVKHILEPHGAIRRFRAHQDTTGALRVVVETTSTAAAGLDIHKITHQLRALLEGYDVTVSVVPALPTITRSGKHRWIVSDLAGAHAQRRGQPFAGSPSLTVDHASGSARGAAAP